MTDSTNRRRPRSPLALRDVTVIDDFWAPRREIVRTNTLPQQEAQLRATGQQFEALTLQWKPGDEDEPHIFWESDVAKWIEAASYVLERCPDPELESSVDEAIALLAGAQQPDGYLNTYFTVVKPGERFTDLRDAHELYCLGHLIEAAVAHVEATGKTGLLEIVTRYADLVDREFGPGGTAEGGYDGHQEIELALVKLGRLTGEQRYIALAKRLIDNRGQRPFYFDAEEQRRGTPGYFAPVFEDRLRRDAHYREYNQSHLPVRQQSEAVGHSVRAVYMYSAMADLAEEYGDDELRAACERLWESVTSKKMYITGGIGSEHSIEGFGPDYDLPDAHGYAETCAAVGLVMWSQRMALLSGHGRYVDVLERALYNGVLSGASADGTRYFYGNPLASDGSVHRHEWFGVACCPPNFARLLSSLEHYIYFQGRNEAIVNLFVSGAATFQLDAGTVTITQEGEYPWAGDVTLRVDMEDTARFTISVRVPGWAAGEASMSLGDDDIDIDVVDGYVRLDREWMPGDTISVHLPMPVRRMWAKPDVAEVNGKVAVQRGPIVYCAEGIDHPVPAGQLTLPRSSEFDVTPLSELSVDALTADGYAEHPVSDDLYSATPARTTPCTIRLIPYFAWANRGDSSMAVWLRETPRA